MLIKLIKSCIHHQEENGYNLSLFFADRFREQIQTKTNKLLGR